MTSNLVLSAFDIPLGSIYIQPFNGSTVDEDLNQYNLMSRNRYSLFQFGSGATWNALRYDLGSAATTRASNHLIIGRADILKTAGVSNIVLRGSPAFDPESVTGCIGWYDANKGITKDGSNLVSAWADQSGTGNTASQGTGANQPLWVAPTSGFNGNAYVNFDGTNDFLIANGLSAYVTGNDTPFTLFVAFQPDSPLGTGTLWSAGNSGTGNGHIRTQNDVGFVRFNRTDDAATSVTVEDVNGVVTTSANVLSQVFSGTTNSAWMNGTIFDNAVSLNVGTITTNQSAIGALYRSTTSTYFKGKIGELLLFNSALGTTDRQKIENYLIAKWVTTPAHQNASFSSAVLCGPRANDYVAEFTSSSAYRWWQLEYYGTSQKFCHSKASFGSWIDLGNPSQYTIDRVPGREAVFISDSGVQYQNRVSEEIYKLQFKWKHVTRANATDFMNKVARFAHRSSFFLYTTGAGGQHDLLDSQRCLHVRIPPNGIKREDEYLDYENITVDFEEVLG